MSVFGANIVVYAVISEGPYFSQYSGLDLFNS